MLRADLVREMVARRERGEGTRQIARELAVDRKTVRRWLRVGGWQPRQGGERPRAIDPYIEFIEQRGPEVDWNGVVLHRELVALGFSGSYQQVQRLLRPRRARRRWQEAATVRFETEPGEQAQVDYGQLQVWIEEHPETVHLFVLTLGYSRRLFTRGYRNERLATLLDGHEQLERLREHCHQLRLYQVENELTARLEQAAKKEISYAEFLDELLALEVGSKAQKHHQMRIAMARFPVQKTLESFDFKFQPSVDPKQIRELASGRYMQSGDNVLFLGPPGVGKSHLAVSLGMKACEQGVRTLFSSATALIAMLGKALAEGRLEERLKILSQPQLLIIDEIGYLPIYRQGANLFFQLVSRRYERGSIIITSNQSLGAWGEVFGDPVIASAILDRLLHHSITINIKGESFRLKEKLKAGLLKPKLDSLVDA